MAAKLDSHGSDGSLPLRAVVDALVIGTRRPEKIGRLLRERLMRRRVDATGRGTTARRMGAARLRGWRRRSRGGDRTGRYDNTGGAEWFSGHDRDGRNYDTNRDDSEHADRERAEGPHA